MMQRLVAAVALLLIGDLALFPGNAVAQDETIAVITSPVDGQQLFGLVNIIGSAAHATAFSDYRLEYNDLSDPNAPWMLVQPPVSQQVNADVIGAWNTNMVPDGIYQLRLRVVLTDGTEGEFVVSSLRVINSQPTPVPTLAAGGIAVSPAPPTPGPSPTSPVHQPPSSNPDAGSVTGLDTGNGPDTANVDADPESTTTRINTGRIRSAFCSGVYLALIAFVGMLVYSLLRGSLRPLTRRWRDY
jgi:hypothetical protein